MERSGLTLWVVVLTLGLTGALFVVLAAAVGGLATWLLVGALILIPLAVIAAVALARTEPAGRTSFEGAAPHVDDGVHRVLIVVDEAADAADVDAEAGTTVFVVAPALSSRLDRVTGDERAYREAQERLEETLRALRARGVDADGRVGSHDPIQAADEALRGFPADEIVLVLGADGDGRWLEEGVTETARARYGVPVSSVRP